MCYRNQGKIKTAVIYGDSISTTEFGGGGYQSQLQELLQIPTLYNYAISGSGLSRCTPDNLITLLDRGNTIHPEADLIIIWIGTNDWYWGTPIESSSSNPHTFQSDLELVISHLQKECPKAHIVYLTPLFRYQAPDQCEIVGPAYTTSNRVGATLQSYNDIIWKMSQKYCFTLVDMRCLTHFHLHNAPTYLPDLIHPSKEGYEKIAHILVRAIDHIFF